VEPETCKKELVIEVPVDVVQRETESVTSQYRRLARIPGFRRGHAPPTLVLNRFRKDIQSEVVQSLLPKYFDEAVKGQKLSVVGRPRFEELKFETDQPLTCKATFEVFPEFELKEYKGLTVEEEAATVSDDDVEQALRRLQDNAATFEVVEGRGAADGDTLTVSYRGTERDHPQTEPLEAKEAMVSLGAEGTVAAFTENLRGVQPGEVRDFDVPYPADYPQKNLAGKTYHYRVEIQSLKKKVLPALDDELAKSVSEFSTLDELRLQVREDLDKTRQQRAEETAKQKLVEELEKAHPIPVPEALVEAQLDRRLEGTLTRLLSRGIDPRTVGVDWRKIREDSRAEAERDVRGALLLERIADVEKIEVSEEEVDELIRQMAAERREPPATLKTRLTQEGMVSRIKSSRRNQKALDLVYHSAIINRKSE
jgi:trigger factor